MLKEECNLPPLTLTKKDLLGKGSFAPVYLESCDGMAVAVKVISLNEKAEDSQLELILGEIRALKLVREAGDQAPLVLLRSLGSYFVENGSGMQVGMVMEYLNGFNVEIGIDIWHARNEQLSSKATEHPYTEPVIAKVMACVLEGLDFLHANGWIHRDIKPANIVITKEGLVKLVDFGLARPGKFITHTGCSKGYAAPELLMHEGHGTPYDCWTLAATAFEMHTGTMAIQLIPNISRNFDKLVSGGEILDAMNNYLFPALPHYLEKASDSLADFIIKTMQADPDARLTVKQLIEHAFVQGQNAMESDLSALWLNLAS